MNEPVRSAMTPMTLRCVVPLSSFDLDLDVSFNARVAAVFGPSGAGKTSLLDAVAGLRRMKSGEIEIDGRVLFSSTRGIDLAPQRRGIGYVPQETALFPHLDVKTNILFGAGRRTGTEVHKVTLDHVCRVLDISRLLERPIATLSGGECQRVALARAILSWPLMLLFDEPLAALDISLKEKILPYLIRVRDEFATPMIYVTHNPAEVLALADWVIVIKEGRLVTQGLPKEVLASGRVLVDVQEEHLENVLEGRLIESDPKAGRSRVELASGEEFIIPYTPGSAGDALQIRIHADDILLATSELQGVSAANVLAGTVKEIDELNGQAILRVVSTSTFYVRVTWRSVEKLSLTPGSRVFLAIKARSCAVI